MAKVYLGLGSNIDAERNLRVGVNELRRRYGDLELSRVYESKAVGFDGADFLNLVVGLETEHDPAAIEIAIENIHELAGRHRGEEKFAARALDIDLLLYGELVQEGSSPRLPRADILAYSFVLRPLAEIAPETVHPVTGKTLSRHWQEFDRASHPLTPMDVIL